MCVLETPGRSSGCQAFLHAQHGLEERAGPLIVSSAAGGTSVWRKSEAFHKGGNLKAGKVRLMVVKLRVAGTFFDG